MKKQTRIILYIISALALVAVVLAMIVAGRDSRGQEQPVSANKNPVTETQTTEESEQVTEQDTHIVTPETEIGQEAEATTLIFTGDMLFANSFQLNYDNGGIEHVVSKDLIEELNAADITMVNEEFPFSTRGTQMPDKQYTFRTDPKYAGALKELGVDVVTIANNHILDYGQDALSDTCQTLDDNGILYAGAGESVDRATELQIIEVNGKKFGFLAASRVLPVEGWNVQNAAPGVLSSYDPTLLLETIKTADTQCDVLIVYVHWGVEHASTPENYQRTLATQYVEAGADVVIGAHTHCLQGIEYVEGKPVFYSLGNFIFGSTIDQTMAVKMSVDADDEITCQLVGAKASGALTSRMDALEQQQLNEYIQQISYGVTVGEDGIITNANK